MLFAYSLFGLHLHSVIELPELLAIAPLPVPDVVISRGAVDLPLGLCRLPQPIDNGLAIRIEEVATFAIRSGSSIVVDVQTGVPSRNVRVYLLGSVMGMLLHQRGILPLHANAVEIGGRAFAFMGASGAGKSTLAAWFHDRGHRVIADDVCAVTFDGEGRAVISPGLPRLRLWDDALIASGRSSKNFARSFSGSDEREKFDVPLVSNGLSPPKFIVGGIYRLEAGPSSEIRPMIGMTALDALFSNTYRGSYLSLAGRPSQHFETCARLARNVPMFIASRRWGHKFLDSEGASLANHARALAIADKAGKT